MRRPHGAQRSARLKMLAVPALSALVLAGAALAPSAASGAAPQSATPQSATPQPAAAVTPRSVGELDCNGLSPVQKPAKVSMMCIDPRGASGGRFSDNGHQLSGDDPSVRFISDLTGSGRNFKITERLPVDPPAPPAVAHPGKDVTHWFELSIAPWISTVVCDPDSAPLLPCTPGSDANAPKGSYPGAGSAFVEIQFYPPGFAPASDSISCDNKHWCSALTIDSLECAGAGGGPCNNHCVEPVNFAFIQTNGVPAGPPSPQLADSATVTPNSKTLLMNPGDEITVRFFNAAIKGGSALEVVETDHTTGQSGFMIASGANGFMNTNPFTCAGSKFNFQPEYNTAKASNYLPWGIGPYMVNDAFETGHFEACTKVTQSASFTVGKVKDTYFKDCSGPYQPAKSPAGSAEPDQAPCYKQGDKHHGLAAPNVVTGCDVFLGAIGDRNYAGSAYRADWPDATVPDNFPTPFLQQPPTTTNGTHYASFQFMTGASTTELSADCDLSTGTGCALPPKGPGKFYPYFTLAKVDGSCVWEFGNLQNGDAFGGDKQYGTVGAGTFGAFAGPVQVSDGCAA
ncbi:MAG TPA: hypothetical protein VMR14_01390 [Streptosporangiaceae bacterium]|nr:hypothetical protein [Streptosporangiaceae bacterium]